jgi:Ca2+-binding EF-hand superfamily protein
MKINLSDISDKKGYVDSSKLQDWLEVQNSDATLAERTRAIKYTGYDFVKPMKAKKFLKRYIFAFLFIDLDKDKSGYLDKNEIKEILTREEKVPQEFKKVFSQLDLDGDDKININEFFEAFLKVIPTSKVFDC